MNVKKKPLAKIKHGDKVVTALESEALFYADIVNRTSLDPKTLQLVVDRLSKNGYIAKDPKGMWTVVK